jgi:hypothetical protein
MVCIRQVAGLDVGVAVVASFDFDAPPEERGAVVDEEDRAAQEEAQRTLRAMAERATSRGRSRGEAWSRAGRMGSVLDVGAPRPHRSTAAAEGSLLDGKHGLEVGESTDALDLVVELCALRSR